jgi:polyisoprenoid-binding protein YceI
MRNNNEQWTIDASHTDVEFAVRHLMISTVKGRFADVSGTVELDPERPAEARADVTIQVGSIDTRNAERDAHLRSPDFFDVDEYPVMTYRSRRVESLGHGTLRVLGDLTIRGTTREVPLTVTPGGLIKDPWGNVRVGYSATAVINRSAFGLTWNKALEAGGVLVGEEVTINLELELVRQAERAAA